MNIATDDIKEAFKIHEVSSALVPGVIFIYGLNLLFPTLGRFVTYELSIGSLIIFLILAYGAGHLIQSVGNLIEIYLIEYVFGDLRKLKPKKKVESRLVRTFKNHKKVCRGIASSLLILLILAWINGIWSIFSFYTFFMLGGIICLFWYMRQFERNELGL